MRKKLTAIVVAITAAVTLSAQAQAQAQAQPQTPDTPQPTFRAATELIAIDATVVNERGEPVPNLTPEDFELTIDGNARRVVSAEFIRHEPAAPTPALAARKLSFSSNEKAIGGRLILIVFDLEGIGPGGGRDASQAAIRFLDQLSAADRVGVLAFPNGIAIEFTDDREKVKEGLMRVVGRGTYAMDSQYSVGLSEAFDIDRGDGSVLQRVIARECANERGDELGLQMCQSVIISQARSSAVVFRTRVTNSLRTLRNLLLGFRKIDAPKTIVWISEGLPLEQDQSEIGGLPSLAAAARTTLYALHLDQSIIGDASRNTNSPSLMQDRQLLTQGLATVAGITRGAMFSSIGSGSNVFTRIAREMTAYYLLSAEPEDRDRDGKRHRIKVAVRRPGLNVRARSEFTLQPGSDAALTPEQRVATIIAQPVLATELPLKVATYNLRTPGSANVKVVVTTEFGRGATAQEYSTLGYVVLTDKGKIATSSFQKFRATPLKGDEPSPLQISTLVELPPGRYTLRLAVLDGRGRGGSVEHAVDAAITTGGALELADLMLAPISTDTTSAVRLLADPTITNELFGAYLELYPKHDDALRDARVAIEVAEADRGPAMVAVAAPIVQTKEKGRVVAQAPLPVGMLPPGDYVARAVVTAGGRTTTQTRPFRLVRAVAAGHEFKADLASRVGQFSRDQVLQPRLLGPALAQARALDAAPPEAARQIADEVAAGRLEALERGGLESDSSLLAAFLRGVALYRSGNLEGAAQQMRAAIRLSPDFLAGSFYLGACYAAGGRGREAVGAWQTSLIGNDSSPEIFELLIDGFLRLGDTDAAIAIVEEAAAKWPDDYRFVLRATLARAAAGDTREALARLQPWLDRKIADREALELALRLALADLATRPAGNRADAVAALKGLTARFETAARPLPPLAERWLSYLAGREQAQ